MLLARTSSPAASPCHRLLQPTTRAHALPMPGLLARSLRPSGASSSTFRRIPTMNRALALAALLALAACGGDEPAPQPSTLEQQVAAPKRVEQDVNRSMDAAQARMDAEMRAATGAPADTAARP